ncbi:ParA family protein (plasmid) [Entomospira entomophila]|uniref:ParA family protein n=1 Tax=Entomospira entomophila TaxID=2719988 RepID=A0A968GF94_9SPIO|nr:ParA family protein [Entomospira entomophilus]NIZ41374.1 ParA family protein [Entomospira entomophilus]WDI36215.1 ParA family protein [Entomospira entomophilus]
MKKIAFHILKGGVGKTTISGNIGAYLATKGKTVVIDADLQGNLSSWLFKGKELEFTLVDYLVGRCSLEAVIQPISDNFYLLPTASGDNELKQWAETQLSNDPFAFIALSDALTKANFLYAIFDLSPSISLLERSIIGACNEVVIPLEAEMFSLDGLESFIENLTDIEKKYRTNIKHDILVCNKLNRSLGRQTAIYQQIQTLSNYGYEIYTIPQDARLAECPLYHETIFETQDRQRGEKKLKPNEELKSIPQIKALGDVLCR